MGLADKGRGIWGKFTRVERADGTHRKGEKHANCAYFVLDLSHDRHAYDGIRAYAASCEDEYPALAKDLRAISRQMYDAQRDFVGYHGYFPAPVVDDPLLD